ncbi:hypothetical protein FHT76_000490 [Rhizobium sp. BK176]|nr:hypothetical protein [Rhizobium sp. BK176]
MVAAIQTAINRSVDADAAMRRFPEDAAVDLALPVLQVEAVERTVEVCFFGATLMMWRMRFIPSLWE